MSFHASYAGKVTEIRDALAQEGGAHDGNVWKPFAEGSGELGKLVHKFLQEAAALAPEGSRLFIEATGHNDPANVGASIRIQTMLHPSEPPAATVE